MDYDFFKVIIFTTFPQISISTKFCIFHVSSLDIVQMDYKVSRNNCKTKKKKDDLSGNTTRGNNANRIKEYEIYTLKILLSSLHGKFLFLIAKAWMAE